MTPAPFGRATWPEQNYSVATRECPHSGSREKNKERQKDTKGNCTLIWPCVRLPICANRDVCMRVDVCMCAECSLSERTNGPVCSRDSPLSSSL